jgi:hypothetical protein
MTLRRRVAAALWLVLAFLVWNVRFDYGVRLSAKSYLARRSAYLHDSGPRVEMASSMRAGIDGSARAATMIALPFAGVALGLTVRRTKPRAKPQGPNAHGLRPSP